MTTVNDISKMPSACSLCHVLHRWDPDLIIAMPDIPSQREAYPSWCLPPSSSTNRLKRLFFCFFYKNPRCQMPALMLPFEYTTLGKMYANSNYAINWKTHRDWQDNSVDKGTCQQDNDLSLIPKTLRRKHTLTSWILTSTRAQWHTCTYTYTQPSKQMP